MFEVPNLDGMDDDDLRAARDVFDRLKVYAMHTLLSRQERRAGDVEAALAIERTADKIYRSLPTWARW